MSVNIDYYATNVELQDIPSYSTTITVEGQLLKLSFLWNERIGKRVLSIKNSSDVVYLQNTILHPNETLELNSNAILDDLPYSVTLVKTGDQKRVGNIFNWSKDFILCFSRTVDVEVEKLNVVYGVTNPSTPTIPPIVRPPNNGGGGIPDSDFTKVTYIKTDTSEPMWVEVEYAPENINGELHIDWGDGTQEVLNISDFQADEYYLYLEHEYAVNGEYVIKVYSTTKANYTCFGEITKVVDWGSPFNLQPYFDSNNLIEVPSTLHPSLTNLRNMFIGCTNFNQDIGMWDTSNVTNMQGMFYRATNFNQDISSWDVSKVTDMYAMFEDATSFSQDLSNWCVSNIASKPFNFDLNAPLFAEENQPVWGTCPT